MKIYCIVCKKKKKKKKKKKEEENTDNINLKVVKTKNGRLMLLSKCSVCGDKSQDL